MSYCLSDIRRAYDYLLSPGVGNSTTYWDGEHEQECEQQEVFNLDYFEFSQIHY